MSRPLVPRSIGSASLVMAKTAGALLGGLAIPMLPLLRWRAWHVSALATLAWLALLIVFFALFAGPGLLGHVGLWGVAGGLALMPRRLRALEFRLAEATHGVRRQLAETGEAPKV